MIDIKYDERTGKSEYQLHMERLRRFLIDIQEQGMSQNLEKQIAPIISEEIKWLTDKIELLKKEKDFIETINKIDDSNDSFKQSAVKELIKDIAHCICYPNEENYLDYKKIAERFEHIFIPMQLDLQDELIEDEYIDDCPFTSDTSQEYPIVEWELAPKVRNILSYNGFTNNHKKVLPEQRNEMYIWSIDDYNGDPLIEIEVFINYEDLCLNVHIVNKTIYSSFHGIINNTENFIDELNSIIKSCGIDKTIKKLEIKE